MNNEDRKPYRKPVIQQVKLVPEEAVLGGCKTASAGGGINLVGSGNCVTASCVSSNIAS